MSDDRMTGMAKNLGGKAEEGIGRVVDNARAQLEGTAKQVEGAVQDLYGQTKDAAADAAEAMRERVGEADDFIRTTIEQRPYSTAAVALGIGFLIGRFARRDYD